ncbi:AI-2E family transporter [Flavisolibacter nicotianae]|uniref:AI-2E family transporter n=1 Tax=Flavisolibacter nicotianae TaxID=2364882 RepID=UPI000EB0DFAB|nr:AI-2E family transporter [Flavisolibacter nicotianae]
MTTPLLDKTLKLLLLLILLFLVLYFGKPFLVPVLIATFLSMLLVPLCTQLERKLPRGLAALISVLILLSAVALIVYIVSTQVSNIAGNAEQIERNISEKVQKVEEFVTRSLGIPQQKQAQVIQEQQQESTGKISLLISGFFTSLGGLFTNFIIVLVYIFLFLYFRDHFNQALLRIVPPKDKTNARTIVHDAQQVAQKYLTGLAIMIACLWVMYGIGFSAIGVRNALFYAVLCGLLEIVPFVGNLTGVSITVIMSLAQGSDLKMVLAIVITYAIVQFLQTYILEPLVVGRGISIHPVFTIVGIVGGEVLWGIPGMVLALPIMGVIKIICDHIEPLKPYGFLIGEERKREPGIVRKIKKKVSQ